ncbi:TetR/AcrR family transcriptional regulator [Pendulispora rubella]|uniref:TetR/AcrR family transcriptional regulator n=1 Tax=Pendulispora rubella TaxID=2741070 RepID=A0ABZ2LAB8_9BACT
MRRRLQTEKLDQRREEILDASERIFARKGYHAAGIADIADELGLGHGTFYRYFKNKHDIALQVFDRVMMRFTAIGLEEDPRASNSIEDYRAQTMRILHRWLALAEEQPHLLRFFHEQTVAVDMDRLAHVIEAYTLQTAIFLQNGVDKGFLRADLDVRATAEVLVALIFEGTRRALGMPDADARRRWVDAAMNLMFDGIRAG